MKSIIKKELSVILVNWNGGQTAANCIDSLFDTVRKTTFEIILVDNDSKDESVRVVTNKYPRIKVIKNDFNGMFAGANNQGLAVSEGEYIFILNSDTIVTENAVDALVETLRDTKETAVTCTLLNQDGSIQYNMHRSFPSFVRLIAGLLYKKWNFFAFMPSVKSYLLLNNKFDKDFYVEQAAGAAILLKRSLIERLGYLFDEINFPLLYSDVDLSFRIQKIGDKILCKSNIRIYHIRGQSLKKLPKKSHLLIHLDSFLKFTKKHGMRTNYIMMLFVYGILKKIYND